MRTVLHEEGAGDLNRTIIIESWSRHFTAWIDTWEQDGFKPVHENWLFRAHQRNENMEINTPSGKYSGVLIGMDEKGGLLLKEDGVTKLVSLKDVWFEDEAKKVLQ
jgi:biotin-(acetyl-CoA carboxylase) ligase